MPLQYVVSTRNKKKLIDNSHLFVKEKQSGEKTIWKCDQFYTRKCHARVHTNDESIIKRLGEHNHAGDIARVEAAKVINETKEKAITTQETTHCIATQAYVGVSQAVAGQLPTPQYLKRNIQNARKVTAQVPANPVSLLELSIPSKYRITHSNEPFLLFDSDDGSDRIIIFSTRRNLQLLSSTSNWYADGTFKTAPPLFNQLYSIHGIVNRDVLPLVYILMANKTEESYNKVLSELKALGPTLSPRTIMTDFERAAINAFRAVFPDSDQQGCFFHFSQCLFRSIQSNGLQQLYENDAGFALKMRMIAAIAFVPVADVVISFEHLIDNTDFPEEVHSVLDYFEDTWIGRPNRRLIRRPPRFDHVMWNCFDAAKFCASKTNNACEGWHRSFSELIGAAHPTIWKFLEILKGEQARNEAIMEQYTAGAEPPRKKKKYKDTALRIQTIVNDFENRELLDYLRGIAHNLSF